MSGSAAAATSQPEPTTGVRFRAECQGCGKLVTRHSRKALTWRCPHCKRVNPGPGLLEQMAQPPEPGRRRRRQRRAPAEPEPPADPPTPARPAAAPVRRKAKARAPVAPKADAGQPPALPAAPTPATNGKPRGFFDRMLYGGDG